MKFISAWEYTARNDDTVEFYYDIGLLTVMPDCTVWDNWINGESAKNMQVLRENQYPVWKRIV